MHATVVCPAIPFGDAAERTCENCARRRMLTRVGAGIERFTRSRGGCGDAENCARVGQELAPVQYSILCKLLQRFRKLEF